jgi:hypothetical protein
MLTIANGLSIGIVSQLFSTGNLKMQCYKVFLAAAILMSCNPSVLGNPVAEDFQAEIIVKDRTTEVLQEALQLALEQVLVKTSGDPQVADIGTVHDHLAEAQNYVDRYEYLPDPNDPSHQKLILQVKFSPKSVRQLLQHTVAAQDVSSEEGFSIHVYGIKGLNDFSEVVNYVRALSSVTSVEASTVDSDDVILTVKSGAGLEALKKAIVSTTDHRLTPIETDKKSADSASTMLTYRWVSLASAEN